MRLTRPGRKAILREIWRRVRRNEGESGTVSGANHPHWMAALNLELDRAEGRVTIRYQRDGDDVVETWRVAGETWLPYAP